MKTISKWLVKDSLGETQVVDNQGVDVIHAAEKRGLRFVRFDTFMININFIVKITQIKEEKYNHPADRPTTIGAKISKRGLKQLKQMRVDLARKLGPKKT